MTLKFRIFEALLCFKCPIKLFSELNSELLRHIDKCTMKCISPVDLLNMYGDTPALSDWK